MTTDERIDRLAGIVESLAASVVSHDDSIEAHDRQIAGLISVAEKQKDRIDDQDRRIEGLLSAAEKHDAQIAALAEQIANTERQWQAYLTRLAPM